MLNLSILFSVNHKTISRERVVIESFIVKLNGSDHCFFLCINKNNF
jgi:hypothetical protein